MIKILFVCHGNICRSPMAEFYMKSLAERRGYADQFSIASAATSSEEIGNPVHPGTVRMLRSAGISCEGKRARRLTRRDYAAYDYLIGMDEENRRSMKRLFGGDPDGKIALLLDFTPAPREVADPWYTGDFEATMKDIETGCLALMKKIEEEGSL